MMKPYDVVVVGAGPAGTAAAASCAAAGLSTLVIEEHGTIGYPVQCAGLLSEAAFAECRVSERPVLNTVRGARIASDLGGSLLFDAGKTKAFVVDRGLLDREMAVAAADAGAEFMLKTGFTSISGDRVMTCGIHGEQSIGYRLLIGADGPRSMVTRSLGLPRAQTYLSGIQADLAVADPVDPRFVEIYPDASPEFFGWQIPLAPRRIRVGLCGTCGVREKFERFQARFPGSCLHLVTGTIPLGVIGKTYGKQALIVGDAAGFAKPTSGGGVYTGIRSARLAAETAIACIEEGRFDDAALSRYEKAWQDDFGKELAVGYKLITARQKMTSLEIDQILRAMNDPSIIESIVNFGDMDRPSALIRKLMLKPALWGAMKILLNSGIRQIFG
nr:NAD(P)/FAD-dependent oxidoreductase [Methanosphaerula palustris]